LPNEVFFCSHSFEFLSEQSAFYFNPDVMKLIILNNNKPAIKKVAFGLFVIWFSDFDFFNELTLVSLKKREEFGKIRKPNGNYIITSPQIKCTVNNCRVNNLQF